MCGNVPRNRLPNTKPMKTICWFSAHSRGDWCFYKFTSTSPSHLPENNLIWKQKKKFPSGSLKGTIWHDFVMIRPYGTSTLHEVSDVKRKFLARLCWSVGRKFDQHRPASFQRDFKEVFTKENLLKILFKPLSLTCLDGSNFVDGAWVKKYWACKSY